MRRATRGPLPSSVPRYPIRAVAKMTGLGLDTLRAWERRYGAVQPQRDTRGRMYSDRDVHRLGLLRDAVASGHAIGRIAALETRALRQLMDQAGSPETSASTRSGQRAGVAVRGGVGDGEISRDPVQPPLAGVTLPGPNHLVAALETYDVRALDAALSRAAALLAPLDLVERLLLPALAEVGRRWHRGQATVAQEHCLSAAIRSLLGTLLLTYARQGTTPSLLFATPAGELHELGTLAAATIAAAGGLGVVYLGANLPADDVARSAVTMAVRAVVLGVTGSEETDAEALARPVAEIARRLPPGTELWLGGAAARQVQASVTGAVLCDELPAFVAQLTRLGARL